MGRVRNRDADCILEGEEETQETQEPLILQQEAYAAARNRVRPLAMTACNTQRGFAPPDAPGNSVTQPYSQPRQFRKLCLAAEIGAEETAAIWWLQLPCCCQPRATATAEAAKPMPLGDDGEDSVTGQLDTGQVLAME